MNPHSLQSVKQCDISEVQYLIAQGADLEAQDENGKTALIAACYSIDRPETTPQIISLFECLLNAGANLKTKDKFHRDAVYFAVNDGRIDLVMLFKKYGAKILDSISLLTFINHWPRHLFRNKRAGYAQVLQLILNESPDLESKTDTYLNLSSIIDDFKKSLLNNREGIINRCLECGVDMGRCNPRQLCGKTICYSN